MTSIQAEELRLAEQCAANDRAAQRHLVQQQRAQVHRTLFRIMGSNQHMEDLAQDTFVEVLRSIGSFAGRSSLATWVDSIAARVAYRHLARRETRTPYLHAVDELAADDDPERAGRAREAMRRLYVALDRIEPKHRIAYTLHVLDDRSLQDVARITGASVLAVKNRVWRARRQLKESARRDPVLAEYLPAGRERP